MTGRFRAPEHAVDEWARLIDGWSPASPGGPARGSAEYAERVRAQARLTADRMWSEAFHAGAQWAMERQQHRERVEDGLDLLAVRVEDVTVPHRPGPSHQLWSEPAPIRMSVIRPEEYRPSLCPRCQEPVTGRRPQYPIMPGGRAGPSERVLLEPCRHVISFVDDTLEENHHVH